MLKTTACIALAATALMAWTPLASIPEPASAEAGACIAFGKDSVWGVFPSSDSDMTYAAVYTPSADTWALLEEVYDFRLAYTACTFQWQEDGVFFAIGKDDDDSYLFSYSLYTEVWEEEEIDLDTEFVLTEGACLAYQPNVNYNSQLYPAPGWLYCLPGEGTEF
jgi:hypothetical protein